jgi:hypothetical protein
MIAPVPMLDELAAASEALASFVGQSLQASSVHPLPVLERVF